MFFVSARTNKRHHHRVCECTSTRPTTAQMWARKKMSEERRKQARDRKRGSARGHTHRQDVRGGRGGEMLRSGLDRHEGSGEDTGKRTLEFRAGSVPP